jgi:pyruvate dehydrogenase E1 component beta subunit
VREITYAAALSEGLVQAMDADPSIFVTGIGVDYSGGIFGTTLDALRQFGPKRVFDAPAMENALTGIAIGAAADGKRPVIVHARNDFMFLAFDQMINLAAKWKYMFGGTSGVPIVVRGVIGRGWGQGATHSQSIQSTLAHFPGLNVVMPAFPADAKGLTLAACRHSSPVIILEHRSLFGTKGPVPETDESVPIGKGRLVVEGKDITIVATSFMAYEALHAVEELAKEGVKAELIDPRSIRPLDEDIILESVAKTGHLVVADTSWELCGFASEVAALVAEKAFSFLKAPVRRITLANCPAPVSLTLEKAFYPRASTIATVAIAVMKGHDREYSRLDRDDDFKGPY